MPCSSPIVNPLVSWCLGGLKAFTTKSPRHQIFLASFLLLAPTGVWAQKPEDCLVCHSDKSLTMKKGSQTISLFVDGARFKNSVHGSADCVDCHKGFKADETPHARKILPVDCQSCHEIAAYQKSVHGRGQGDVAARCEDCHGTHNILSPSDPKSPTNRAHLSGVCGKCHEDEASHYSRSAHGTALEQGVKGAPTCVDCHGEHNVEEIASKQSPVYKGHEAEVCLKCHLDNPDVRGRVVPSAGFIADYRTSVHGVALASGDEKAATCSDCHGAHDMKKGSNPTASVNRWNIPRTCGRCHTEIAGVYNESIHGKALQWGSKEAPACTD